MRKRKLKNQRTTEWNNQDPGKPCGYELVAELVVAKKSDERWWNHRDDIAKREGALDSLPQRRIKIGC